MRVTLSSLRRVLLLCLFVSFAAGGAASAASFQDKNKDKPKASGDERKAAQKVLDAKDPAAKIQAASEFVQKYPKSSLRPQVADHLVGQIGEVKDTAQRIKLAESFLGTFSEAAESNRMYPILLDAYVAAKRVEDAFNAAGPWLEANPNEADVLFMLAIVGTEEARQKRPQYAQLSEKYGLKAIELIEANKRPAGMNEDAWNKNKTDWLARLYQANGFLALLTQRPAEAMTRLQKSITLNPAEPLNYVLVANLKNDEYLDAAQKYKATPAGPAREAMEKKINAQLDEIVDLYAHAIGLMQTRPEYKNLAEQLMPEITNYYKYRHNNSTAGLQELINKYKQPPAQ